MNCSRSVSSPPSSSGGGGAACQAGRDGSLGLRDGSVAFVAGEHPDQAECRRDMLSRLDFSLVPVVAGLLAFDWIEGFCPVHRIGRFVPVGRLRWFRALVVRGRFRGVRVLGTVGVVELVVDVLPVQGARDGFRPLTRHTSKDTKPIRRWMTAAASSRGHSLDTR